MVAINQMFLPWPDLEIMCLIIPNQDAWLCAENYSPTQRKGTMLEDTVKDLCFSPQELILGSFEWKSLFNFLILIT